ncbi:MAG: short-chain fatty acyl-CoA regulator family protein, partial [Novosphingobium sp.]
ALLDSDTGCPLWVAHRAFERAGQLCVQLASFVEPSGAESQWLTIARTVEGSGAPGGHGARFVVALGIEVSLAGTLAQARELRLEAVDAVPIGPGCAACHRKDCAQRSLPPRGAALAFDERSRGLTPFAIAD